MILNCWVCEREVERIFKKGSLRGKHLSDAQKKRPRFFKRNLYLINLNKSQVSSRRLI